MISKYSNTYLQWALKRLCFWQPKVLSSFTEIVQIHGDQDRTFHIGLIHKPTYIIKEGNHLMVMHQADKISSLIQNELANDSLHLRQ